MTPDRWQQIEQLFHAALEREPNDRTAFLRDACAGDDSLRLEVESLLTQETAADRLLEVPARDAATRIFSKPQGQSFVGRQVGSYQVISLLGVGGMGEVYEARDTKLGRTVAIKVLPGEFIHDPDRLARFQREAKMLASLNHPNIATIFGLEQFDGVHYLVMELVPGKTLAERIAKGALPLEEALRLAGQSAEALEAAHEKGVIHRDLKPANVKVTSEGRMKVLDFGLAKVFAQGGEHDLPNSATQSLAGTEEGRILGTPAYMSPEQARGLSVDKRTDIWAFGCVLYELLTGKQAFQGDTLSDCVAAVLGHEPDWSAIPATSTPKIRDLLRRSLQKEPRSRLRDIGDARIELDEALTAPVVKQIPSSARQLPVWSAAFAALIGVALLIGFVVVRRRPTLRSGDPVQFTFTPPEQDTLATSGGVQVAPSPDGLSIVFASEDSTGKRALWIRSLSSPIPQRIAGTDGGSDPFWSPDGRFIGFYVRGDLKKIEPSGGPAQEICTIGAYGGATWNRDGTIVLSPSNRKPLFRVSAMGGTPEAITALDLARHQNSHRWPFFLPDGRHFLYTARSDVKETTGIYVGSLDSKETTWLFSAQSGAVYVRPGYLLFVRDGNLMVQQFDASSLHLSGEPYVLAGNVEQNATGAFASFSASDDGSVLTYQTATTRFSQLAWFDRTGKKLGSVGPAENYGESLRLAPDGKSVAVVLSDKESGNRDIWLMDVATGGLTRLTSHPANDWFPVWSSDGTQMAFASDRNGASGVYRKPTNGSGGEELILQPEAADRGFSNFFPTDWSADGRFITFQADTLTTQSDLWMLPMSGDRKPYQFVQTEFNEMAATFSPNGQWVAYVSNESGDSEVYIRPFGKPGKLRVSTAGGTTPRWRKDGRELFFHAANKLMSAQVNPGESFQAAAPVVLFDACNSAGPDYDARYDASPDGKRFLWRCPVQPNTPAQINVVLNWLQEVKRKAPATN